MRAPGHLVPTVRAKNPITHTVRCLAQHPSHLTLDQELEAPRRTGVATFSFSPSLLLPNHQNALFGYTERRADEFSLTYE